MKISRDWLQKYFDKELPDAAALAEALTFHVFEIESIEGDVLDVKVTANRGHDCLSHRGIAKELSAILKIPMKDDPLRSPMQESTQKVIETDIDFDRAPVGAAAYVKGVTIAPSPEWLVKGLEAIGQRSINNVVDATNYVMFDIGCPTHAFDATSFKDGEKIKYGIRVSNQGEKLALLGGASVELTGDEAVIMNAAGEAVDIGGVKGGLSAELKSDTNDVVLSASKFDPVRTRKAAQRFNQRTEAAKRFENEFADDLSVYGIRAVAELVQKVAGGEIVDYAIARSRTLPQRTVLVSLTKVNTVLGITLSEKEITDVFARLDLPFEKKDSVYTVTVPFERLDLVIPEDLIEEIGRIIGYDKVPAVELPPSSKTPEVNQNFYAAEHVRQDLIQQGFSEVFTSAFADAGERVVANKVDGVRPYLRANLTDGLESALKKNISNKDLLGLKDVKLFEIGTVWNNRGESLRVATIVEKKGTPGETTDNTITPLRADMYEDFPVSQTKRYQAFSKYPYIVRDIALWCPESTEPLEVLELIRTHASDLLVRSEKFDEFKKAGRVSYAFRLVFQSFEKTLTDVEVNEIMEKVHAAVQGKGWEVR